MLFRSQGLGTSIINSTLDTKSLVYRSSVSGTSTINSNIVLTFPVQVLGGPSSGIGVVLGYSNLSSTATITVKGFTGTPPTTGTGVGAVASTPGTLVFSSTAIVATPYQNQGFSNWSTDPFYPVTASSTTYSERKVYSRIWVPIPSSVSCTSILIEIRDTDSLNKYIEFSRLIVGNYWSPKYNTGLGMSSGTTDLSSNIRTEAGDLVSSNEVKFNTLSFDLKWMTSTDRAIFNKIVRTLGTRKALFVSLFPDNSVDWDKEQLYQLYGKFSRLAGIDHQIFEMFGSQVEIEEI